jgi:ParB/RepB/Spo0J family partition protein
MSKTVPIKDITVPKDRARKDLGDIDSLAASIEAVGLLQPIVVDKNYRLVAGQRRLEALKRLNCDEARVVVVDGLDDAIQALKAERDENTCRKDFTLEEARGLTQRLKALIGPQAQERRRETQGRPSKTGDKLSPVSKPAKTRDQLGAAVGLSGATYERMERVFAAAEQNPEKFGSVAEEMNRTGKVTPAYEKVIGRTIKPARDKGSPTNRRWVRSDKRTPLEQAATELREMARRPTQQIPMTKLRALVERVYELVYSSKETQQ